MSFHKRIAETLEVEGFRPESATIEGQGGSAQYLTLSLQVDDAGREHSLIIQAFPGADSEEPSIIGFSATLPYAVTSVEVVPEIMRLLFWLNRMTPLGHFGLQEEDAVITFAYNLLASDPDLLETQLVAETVSVIAHALIAKGALIDQVVGGAATCDEVLDALRAQAEAQFGAGQGFVVTPR
ncbi:MAG: hypothetical protein GY701_24740 [Sulfitobacter sp.]|nr:hypothetical protein [Sulfitobacter sp.]